MRIFKERPVFVGVAGDINEAGGDKLAVGPDDLTCSALGNGRSNILDPSALDRNISAVAWSARAVEDCSAFNEEVVGHVDTIANFACFWSLASNQSNNHT